MQKLNKKDLKTKTAHRLIPLPTSILEALQTKWGHAFSLQLLSKNNSLVLEILGCIFLSSKIVKDFTLDLVKYLRAYRLKHLNVILEIESNDVEKKFVRWMSKTICQHLYKPNLLSLRVYNVYRTFFDASAFKASVFSKMRNLQNLSLKCSEMDNYDFFRYINHSLKYLRLLTLDFRQIHFNQENKPKPLKLFLPLLKQLSLNGEDVGSLNDEMLGEMGFGLCRNMQNLRQLFITLGASHSLQGKGLEDFAFFVSRRLRGLKKVEFKLTKGPSVSPESVKNACLTLGLSSNSLEDVSLSLIRWRPKKGNPEVVQEKKPITRGLSQVKSLSIDLERSVIAESDWFFEILRSYPDSLRSVSLSFDFCQRLITDEFLRQLGKELLKRKAQLKRLKLSFRWNDLTPLQLSIIADDIYQPLYALEELDFTVGWTKGLSNQTLDNLVTKSLAKKNLKSLSLRLEGCEFLESSTLISLSSMLGKSKQLNYLLLNFRGCGNLTDEGVLSLSGEIYKKLPDLKTLSLDFQGCNQLTKTSLESFVPTKKSNLKNLKWIYLNFSRCELISEQEFEKINELIETGFPRCNEIKMVFEKAQRVIGDFLFADEETRAGVPAPRNAVQEQKKIERKPSIKKTCNLI